MVLPPEMHVAARIVLHQVARGEEGIAAGDVIMGGGQRGAQRRQRGNAAQPPLGGGEQVRIGELDQIDRRFSQAIQVVGS